MINYYVANFDYVSPVVNRAVEEAREYCLLIVRAIIKFVNHVCVN